MKNKKAMVFSIVLIIILVSILAWVWVAHQSKVNQFDQKLGLRQLELIRAYQKGENLLFYLDKAADYSVDDALFHVAESGFYPSAPENMRYKGYVLWKKGGNKNYPDKASIRKNITMLVSMNFNLYLAKLEKDSAPLALDYDYFISGEDMFFFGSKPIYFPIYLGARELSWGQRTLTYGSPWLLYLDEVFTERYEAGGWVGKYALKHQHRSRMKLDVEFFEYVVLRAGQIDAAMESCGEKLKDCLNIGYIPFLDDLKESGWNIRVDEDDGNIILFDIRTNRYGIIFDEKEGKRVIKEIIIRFALEKGDKIPPEQVDKIETLDNKRAENSVIILWEKSPTEGERDNDIEKYAIYYSGSPFINSEDFSEEVASKVFMLKDARQVWDDIDFENCKDGGACGLCIYSGSAISSIYHLNSPLFYCKKKERYFAFLTGIDDDEEYHIAVAAIDKYGNVIGNKQGGDEDQKLVYGKNYAKAVSKDDLAPAKISPGEFKLQGTVISWDKAAKNIDGTDIKERDSEIKYTLLRDGNMMMHTQYTAADLSSLGWPAGSYIVSLIVSDEVPNYCRENLTEATVTIY